MAEESTQLEAFGPLVLTLLTEQTPGVLTPEAQDCARKGPEACQQLQSQVERKSGQLTSLSFWPWAPGTKRARNNSTSGSARVTPDDTHPQRSALQA